MELLGPEDDDEETEDDGGDVGERHDEWCLRRGSESSCSQYANIYDGRYMSKWCSARVCVCTGGPCTQCSSAYISIGVARDGLKLREHRDQQQRDQQ